MFGTISGAIEFTSRVSDALKRDAAGNVAVAGKLGGSFNSLTDVANVARVEPIMLIDVDCSVLPEAGDIAQAIHSMFSGYYLQAVSLAGSIGGVTLAQKLSQFNPNRPAFESLKDFARNAVGADPFKHRLPRKPALSYAAEAKNAPPQKPITPPPPIAIGNKVIDNLREAGNLSVGKVFNVKIVEGRESVDVPIAIRLLVNVIPDQQMTDLFTFRDSFDMDMKERWHGWLSGRLSGFKDLLLCNDLVDKYRRTAIRDKTGMAQTILNREASHVAASVTTGKVSLATATNLAVMSTNTMALIETKLNGRFSNSAVRRSVFENTNLMILAVVDKPHGMVTFYHRGLDAASTLSFKDIKDKSAKGGMDVADIMKAYMLGNSPL